MGKTNSGSGEAVDFSYNANGRLTNGTAKVGADTNAALTLTYDAAGRLKTELQTVTGATQTVAYDYFDDGRLRRLT